MSTATGGRTAARIGTALIVVLALALVASMCTSSDSDGPGPIGSNPIDPSGTGEVLALGPTGEPVSVRLSAGTAQAGTDPAPITVVEGTPLDDDAVAAIFDRLPEWVRPDEDRLDFNRPPESLKPPLVGDTIEVPFPADSDDPPPPVPGGPLEVLRFQPEGPVDVAPFISITFNQPMVPLATLEQLDTLDVPVNVTPEMPGRWQWIGTRTLRFEHQPDLFDRLPMATEYRVEIPAGTTSQTGGVLAGDVSWTFATPPVQVQSFEPRGDSLPLEPIFLAVTDQRIDPAAVLETITLTADDEQQPLRLATDAEIAGDERIGNRVDGLLEGRWLAFRTVEALQPDSALVIRVGPDTPSTEGPRLTTGADTYTARTYAPLRINDWSCRGDDRCEPGRGLYISFNNPLEVEAFDPSMISLRPELAGMTVHAEYSSISIRGATVGGTTYEATVSAGLTDIYGQTLGKDDRVEFEIDDARPYLNQFNRRLITLDPLAPEPSLAVTTVNHDELRVRLFKVDVDDWASYVAYQDRRWDEQQPAPPSNWNEVLNTAIETGADTNQLTETTIELSDTLDGQPGHLIVLIEPTGRLAQLTRDDNDYWSNRPTVVWAQSTIIGTDVLSDDDELVVWATDLRSGDPLAGVEVGFLTRPARAITNADGLAGLAPPSASSAETGQLVARQGEDSALLDSSWRRSDRSDRSLWYVFDDRKMYRPGETASFKGWVRRLTVSDDAQLAAVGEDARVNYQAADWYGNEIGSGTVDLNSLGGFDFTIDIPAGANLGPAWIDLSLAGVTGLDGHHNHSFEIQEFRRPEFEVTTRAESAGPYLVGQPATVAVEAAYFSGGPLPNADVEWTVTTRQATYSPPNWDDFTFGIWIPWWYGDFYLGGDLGGDSYYEDEYIGGFGPQFDPATVETFNGKTDAGGTHYLQMDFDGDGDGLPTTVTSQATVFDVNRQAWSDGTDLLVHPGQLYVGLRSDRTFVEAGEPLVIEAIATDIDGTAVPGRALTLKAGRLEWKILDGRWQETPVEIETCTVTSADRAVECSFGTDIGGTYQIAATVADDAGRTSKTEITRWVSGGNRRPERNVVQEEVTLIPDLPEYAPGTSAEILVEAPFSPAQGLLTISRNGIVETERFQVQDGTTVLSVPIKDEYTPNIFVQVDLVGATGRTADNGDPLPDAPDRPAFAVGRLNLQVPPLSRTLNVTAVPADPTTEPGTATRVDVTVTNPAGDPVADAELTVVVVDEAVLALTAYELPDPLDVFYRPIESRVSSRYQRRSIELTNPTLLEDAVATSGATTTTFAASGGGDADDGGADFAASPGAQRNRALSAEESLGESGQGDAIDVRTNFDALAVFEPAVRTGPDGTATVEVPLPDNLTRYRVMVVAVDGIDQFGSGESNITARLPLMVRPSAPRFLNFGDQFELPVVIQNQTDQDLEVMVGMQTANLSLTAGAGRLVIVPANDRIEVRFPAAAEDVGTARFRVAAVSGSHADAATVALPVYTPATTEAFATYGVIDDGVIAQPVLAPEGVFPQFGGLEVNTSSTALQALTDAVIYLNDYRYASSDALASRILAIAALRDVLEAFEADGLPPAAELDARVTQDIEDLLRLQTGNGGFAIWRRTNETVPYHSIQATHALVEAKANGYPVPAEGLQQALWYLTNIEDFYPSTYGQQTRDTLSSYALHVRNLAGDRDSTKANALYRRAGDGLGLDAVAWLWPVVSDAGIDAEIERLFLNRATETAGAATFTTNYGEDAYLILHSDRRADGIILDALIAEAPDSDLIPKVVSGLLGHQTRGRWNNVQENSFILLALNNYFDTFESTTPDFVARIWLGDLYAAEHVFEGRTTDRDETLVPMAELLEQTDGGEADLVVSKDGAGRLYYRLGLRYAPDDLDLDPLDRGFVVKRSYEAVDDPGDVTRDADGTWRIKPGAEVRVRLTMVADSRRTHVALVDPMPAGFEALNPALAVTPPIPQEELADEGFRSFIYWWWQWFEHQNLRDDRAEAFASLLWAGTYDYTYVARATTPGTFVVPPTKAEEIYAPETFGRSGSDLVIVESR
ncbi:MAG: alpha-2-macroglobulin family protein [Acidimicrobiia bacterium]